MEGLTKSETKDFLTNMKVYLVQYKVLNKEYSVGFSTMNAAKKALEKVESRGRVGKIVVQEEKYKSQPNPGKRDIQIRLINGSKSQLKSILRKAGFAVGGRSTRATTLRKRTRKAKRR